MIAGVPKGATRIIGKSQGYLGLPIRDEKTGEGTPCMVTAWFPTEKELAALNSGASVQIHLQGSAHPPIMVDVGDPPE